MNKPPKSKSTSRSGFEYVVNPNPSKLELQQMAEILKKHGYKVTKR